MLWFVGMGISGPDSMSADARRAIEQADDVFLEQFTSPAGDTDESAVSAIVKGKLHAAKRWMVEDGTEILRCAKKDNTALVSYGDPYVATTHVELRTRAALEGIATRTIHAASALTAAVGECGLHHYKVGSTATIMRDPAAAASTYYSIYRNLTAGLHTVLPLEYDQDSGASLAPGDALGLLLGAEEGQARRVVGPDTFAVVASRIGLEGQLIVAGRISSLRKAELGGPPHTVIIPGRLHFTESDALGVLAECIDKPADNGAVPISHQMIAKYVPMVRAAISKAQTLSDTDESKQILYNAELYVRDAENFLGQGQDEVAVLCIGYADGLADSLLMAAGQPCHELKVGPHTAPYMAGDASVLAEIFAESLRQGGAASSSAAPQLVGRGLVDADGRTLTERGRGSIQVVLAGGVFDIIHPGHIHTLGRARALGDVLVVVVATDETARRMKGRTPLHGQDHRRDLVGSLRMVDVCLIGDESDIFETVKRVRPDVIALGYDQAHQEGFIREGCQKAGLRIDIKRLDAPEPGISSSEITHKYGESLHDT